MSDPLRTFEDLQASAGFLFIVYYRGTWCPFCNAYLKDFEMIASSVRSAQGVPIAITSQVPNMLSTMRTQTNFSGEMIADPTNSIAAELKRKYNFSPAISEKKDYEHGMAQPAVFVLKRDGTVLHQWAIAPGMMNLGGAKDRPSLSEIWEDVQGKLHGRAVSRKSYSTQSFFKVVGAKLMGH